MELKFLRIVFLGSLLTLNACYTAAGGVADQLNPYAEGGAELGQRNTSALGGGGAGKNADQARHALEVLGTYRRAQAPQPYFPVVQPAEIRLMWIPDHINRLGDLVPAHYYYLRVTKDIFQVQDAFDIERQLESNGTPGYGGGAVSASGGAAGLGSPVGGTPGGGAPVDVGGGATPWQYKEGK